MEDNDQITDSLGFIIYRTALALKAALQRCFKDNGYEITAEQWGIIRQLREEEGLSQREIGERAAKDKPNITRMLDVLEKRRLLFRQPDPRDRRKYRIYLSREGKQLYEGLAPLASTLREGVTRNLTRQELDRLQDTLNKINRNLDRLGS
jgi:DNA-binding MarR family transcriptional regulator